MKLQYAPFLLPLYADSPEQEALNRFIRGHRVIQTRKELVAAIDQHYWAILVEYIDSPVKEGADNGLKNKIDYKEILNIVSMLNFACIRRNIYAIF
ncbi:hypothetical protein LQZ19_02005 [Treponema primitia]|uniref:hypothetical protein n=1 Tax=Treponema primitia TaxID=88058 RepID=UPI00397F2286